MLTDANFFTNFYRGKYCMLEMYYLTDCNSFLQNYKHFADLIDSFAQLIVKDGKQSSTVYIHVYINQSNISLNSAVTLLS